MLELNTPVSEGKSAVQRDACAAVVAAFNGGTTGGSSGDEGDDGDTTAVGRREAPVSRVTAVLPPSRALRHRGSVQGHQPTTISRY